MEILHTSLRHKKIGKGLRDRQKERQRNREEQTKRKRPKEKGGKKETDTDRVKLNDRITQPQRSIEMVKTETEKRD